MSESKISMYYIRFWLELRPMPHALGEHTALPRCSSWILGPYFYVRGREEGLYSAPNISLKSVPLCESITHRLTAVGTVTCDHKITTDNKLYKL